MWKRANVVARDKTSLATYIKPRAAERSKQCLGMAARMSLMVKSGTWNSLPFVSTNLPYCASELTNWPDSLVSTTLLDCSSLTSFPMDS